MAVTLPIDEFFNSGFESTAEITVNGVELRSVVGIYDKGAQFINPDEPGIMVKRVTFLAATSDLTDVKRDDPITVQSTQYKVMDVNDDGTGVTELILKNI